MACEKLAVGQKVLLDVKGAVREIEITKVGRKYADYKLHGPITWRDDRRRINMETMRDGFGYRCFLSVDHRLQVLAEEQLNRQMDKLYDNLRREISYRRPSRIGWAELVTLAALFGYRVNGNALEKPEAQ